MVHSKVVTKKEAQRTNVVVALDVSGSMAGAKLASALQAIRDLDAACLKAGDTLSVLAFNTRVDTVLPVSKKVGGGRGHGGGVRRRDARRARAARGGGVRDPADRGP